MKKALLIFFVIFSITSMGFAEISVDLDVKTIEEKSTTEDGLPYLMTIKYIPGTGEAFFIFSMKTPLFDSDFALLSIRNRAEQFLKETVVETEFEGERADQLYYSYTYRGADSVKHDIPNDITHYTSRLLFSDVKKL